MFDFISSPEFRQSLESDYAEMRRCLEGNCWKSVQVLAGSIVEALLIDYLTATTHPTRPATDPLRMDLAEAVDICLAEGLLDQRSADLSSVVRSYRNLIHPGRAVRLLEELPSEASAGIALNLVSIITSRVELRRRQVLGLTAEQLLSKIERDAESLNILSHLLIGVDGAQRKRLLLELMPRRFLVIAQATKDDEEPSDLWMAGWRIEQAFHETVESSDLSLKELVARRFVQVLREDDGETVTTYRGAFFRPNYLAHLNAADRALVKQHLLGSGEGPADWAWSERLKGITPFLSAEELRKWANPHIRTLIHAQTEPSLHRQVKSNFLEGVLGLDSDLHEMLLQRMDKWAESLRQRGDNAAANRLQTLREEATKAYF